MLPDFKHKMEYEQFFSYQVNDKCGYENTVIMILGSIILLSLLCDCISECKSRRKLTNENETLKTIIVKSVDRTLMNMMKNGIDEENCHQD